MIELRDVTKTFGSTCAVDRLSLAIQAGEFLTLLGPSGCGKTTLLRLIGGFDLPDSGTIMLAGVDMTRLPPYRRAVNQVFQSYALFPHLTVERNVAFGLKMAGVPRAELRQRVRDALALVSLTGLERRRPSELSGGQKQRVALARALINRPKVLLLDEPLAALDARLRQAVQLELKQLQRQLGITFVFVTHDQDEAMTLSDRIAVMHEGRLLQIDSPQNIYQRPTSLRVAQFVGQANCLTAAASPDRRGVTTPGGLRFDLSAPAPRVVLVIRPQHIRRVGDGSDAIAAVIAAKIFRGETNQYLLQTSGGETLTVSGWQDPPSLQVGQRVLIRIDPAMIHCFVHDSP